MVNEQPGHDRAMKNIHDDKIPVNKVLVFLTYRKGAN